MSKDYILSELLARHQHFSEAVSGLSEHDFLYAVPGKWSAGQQLDHIYRAVNALLLPFRLPKFVLRMAFGTANRPSRDYDALVAKYHAKLAGGGRASGRFLPPPIAYNEREAVRSKTLQSVQKLCKALERYSEEDLDRYILPHPLLGRITLREMMYFTAYHVEHHEALTKRNLSFR
ncbi:MAG: DinB family protein [Candidatus Kapaibacteriota bacterium]